MNKEKTAVVDKKTIDALRTVKNSNLLVKIIKSYIDKGETNVISLLDEIGTSLDSLGGIDLAKLETLSGKDGKTPILGEDYMTEKEIEGLESFIKSNVETIGTDLTSRIEGAIDSANNQIKQAVSQLKDGKDGVSGKDVTRADIEAVFEQYKDSLKGSPDNPLEIVEKIKQVRGSKRLGFKNVRGLPELEQTVKNNTDDIKDLKTKAGQGLAVGMLNSDSGGGGGGGGAITSVNGETGVVVLDKSDIGLNNVDNTSDAAKPISTATQTALNNKADEDDLADVATSGNYNDLSNLPNFSAFDEVEQHTNQAAFPTSGDAAKFYLAQDTGILYRWASSAYTQISAQLALGETASTAYRGDRGKIAYDHSQASHAPAGATVNDTDANLKNRSNHTGTQAASTISDFDTEVANNTTVAANTTARHSHSNKSVLDATTASFTTADETKLDGIEASANVTDEANVKTALNGASLTAVTVAADDKVIIQDTSDSNNVKSVTAQAIADLASGGGLIGVRNYSASINSFMSIENVATGNGVNFITIPAHLNNARLTEVLCSFAEAGVGTGQTEVQIRRQRSSTDVDMLSTKVTLAVSAFHQSNGVIDTSNDQVQTGDKIFADVDSITTTPPAGLSTSLVFTTSGGLESHVGVSMVDSNVSVAIEDGASGIPISAALNHKKLTAVTVSVATAGTTGGTTDVQVRRRRGGTNVDMLSTAVTLGVGEFTASDGVVNTSNDELLVGDLVFIDVEAINTVAPQGLSATLTFS